MWPRLRSRIAPPTPIPRRSYGWCLEVRGKLGASRSRRVTRGPARALVSFYPFKNEPQPLFKKFPVSTEKDHLQGDHGGQCAGPALCQVQPFSCECSQPPARWRSLSLAETTGCSLPAPSPPTCAPAVHAQHRDPPYPDPGYESRQSPESPPGAASPQARLRDPCPQHLHSRKFRGKFRHIPTRATLCCRSVTPSPQTPRPPPQHLDPRAPRQ